jgi:plasmid stability protein
VKLYHYQFLTAMLAMLAYKPMATLTVRNLSDDVYHRLRVRAAENHRSMEAEVRTLLRDILLGGEAGQEALEQSAFAERAKGRRNEKPSKSSRNEALQQMRDMIARLPKEAQDKLSVDSFLAERRAMWGEDE